jgi:hypothetical protein
MAGDAQSMVIPQEFPELRLLVWNRDAAHPIPRAEAFEIYERQWRHVDADRLTAAGAALIRGLAEEFGRGHLLVG